MAPSCVCLSKSARRSNTYCPARLSPAGQPRHRTRVFRTGFPQKSSVVDVAQALRRHTPLVDLEIMLLKLRATSVENVRRTLAMSNRDAKACIMAEDPAAARDAWLASDAARLAAESRAAGSSMDVAQDSASAAPGDTGSEDVPATESEKSVDLDATPPAREPAVELAEVEVAGDLGGGEGTEQARGTGRTAHRAQGVCAETEARDALEALRGKLRQLDPRRCESSRGSSGPSRRRPSG